MITQTSGSIKSASENVSAPAVETFETAESDLATDSQSFAGSGLPPNNPNNSKANLVQRSSQTLKKPNHTVQRQKAVQAIQRKFGNAYAARMVANYNKTNNPVAGTIQKKPAESAQTELPVKIHTSRLPDVIDRACCDECEEKEQQLQRSFDPAQPVVTESHTEIKAELETLKFPAKSPELVALESGADQTGETKTGLDGTLARPKAIKLAVQAKEAAVQPTIKVETLEAPNSKAGGNSSQSDSVVPEKGRELLTATFKEAQKSVEPLHEADKLKWDKATAAYPQLATGKAVKIQPTLNLEPGKSFPAILKKEQFTHPVAEQNKAVAEKAMESSKTALGKLGEAGAFFMPDRKEFLNDSLEAKIPDGFAIQRTPLPGANTSLGMEKVAQKERERRARVEAMVSQFLAVNSGKGQEILNAAGAIPGQIMGAASSARGQLSAALGQTLGTISQEFESAKAQVASQAQAAVQTITQQHTQALTQIKAATVKASQYLVTARQAAATELQSKLAKEEEVFNQTYAKWQPKFTEEGNKVGQEATQIAENKAKEYESKKINRDDNIFDGPLTDKRMEARANTARQVGTSYSKSMQDEGTKQATKMMEGKAKDIENLRKEVGEKVNTSLDEAVTKANEDLQKAETEVIKIAQETQAKLTEAANTNAQQVQAQLDSAQASSTNQANSIADQLTNSIDQTANGSVQAITQSAQQAAQKVTQSLGQLSQSLRGSTAPNEAAMSAALGQAQGQISSMVADIIAKLSQSGNDVEQGLSKLAQQGSQNLGGVEQQATQQAQSTLQGFNDLITQLVSSGLEAYTELTKAHEENATTRAEFIKEQYKELFKAVDDCFVKINQEMDQGFAKSVQEFGQALRDYMNGSSADALIPLIEKHAEEAASKVEPRWLTVLKILVAIVISIVIAVVLGPAVIGAIGAFAGALGASAAVAGAIGAIVGGAIVGAIGGALSQLANNVISNLAGFKTDLLDGVLESFISGAVGGALGGAGGLLIKAGDSFLKTFVVEVGSDILGGLVGDNVANLAVGKPLDFNLSPMDIALSVITTGLTNDKVMNKIPGMENFQNKGMEFGQNFGTKLGSTFRPDFKVSAPNLPTPKLPEIKNPEIKGGQPRGVDNLSTTKITPKGIDGPNLPGVKLPDISTPEAGNLGKPDTANTKATVKEAPAPTPTPENGGSGGGKGKDKPLLHEDAPEIEPYVVAKKPTADGEHNLKVLKDGRIARCSTCGELSVAYGAELLLSPSLKAELEAAKANADPDAKVAAAQRIEAQLKTIQDLKLALQSSQTDSARIDQFIRSLEVATNIPAIMQAVNNHGLKNAVTTLNFNNLVAPTNPPAVNTREAAYTLLATELQLRPGGQAPGGTPAADPPVANFGATITKLKLEALGVLQKRLVDSSLKKLQPKIKDWETLLQALPPADRDAVLTRLGFDEMPGPGQLKGRLEIMLKKMVDVEKPDVNQGIDLNKYFNDSDVDLELANLVKDKLANIDPKSPAGVELLKKIKQDFYKKNLVGPDGNASAFRKLLRNLKLNKSSLNSNYKRDKLTLQNKITNLLDTALDPNAPLTTADQEFLALTANDKKELDSIKDSVHSNLQKLGVVLEPMLAQPGDKAKTEAYLRIPLPDPSGATGGFIGLRLTLQGEHDIEFNEVKPKDDSKLSAAENAEAKLKARQKQREELGPLGGFLPKAGDGMGKQVKENLYKVRAEIALTGGYQALDITSGYKKLFDVGGEGGFYVEAESNTSVHKALELISFGIQRRLLESKIPPANWAADMVWGKPDAPDPAAPKPTRLQKAKDWFSGQKWKDWYKSKQQNGRQWEKDFRKGFSEKDYVETGGLVNVFGGLPRVKLKGNLKYTGGKRYTRQTMKALMDVKSITETNMPMTGRQQNIGRNIHTTELALEGGVGPFTFGGKAKMGVLENQLKDPAGLETKVATKLGELNQAKQDLGNDPDNAALKKAVEDHKKEYDALILQQKVLPRQIFNLEGEVSAQSKGGSVANPEEIAALVINASGNLAVQLKTLITSQNSSYGKDRKFGYAVSSALTGLPAAVDAAVLSHIKASGSNWALKGGSGMKITIKTSLKRDFGLADKGGMWYDSGIGKAPFKFEIILEEVGNLTVDSIMGGGTIEKSSRLVRLGFKYKEGNWTLMDDSVVTKTAGKLTNPRATDSNTVTAPTTAPNTTPMLPPAPANNGTPPVPKLPLPATPVNNGGNSGAPTRPLPPTPVGNGSLTPPNLPLPANPVGDGSLTPPNLPLPPNPVGDGSLTPPNLPLPPNPVNTGEGSSGAPSIPTIVVTPPAPTTPLSPTPETADDNQPTIPTIVVTPPAPTTPLPPNPVNTNEGSSGTPTIPTIVVTPPAPTTQLPPNPGTSDGNRLTSPTIPLPPNPVVNDGDRLAPPAIPLQDTPFATPNPGRNDGQQPIPSIVVTPPAPTIPLPPNSLTNEAETETVVPSVTNLQNQPPTQQPVAGSSAATNGTGIVDGFGEDLIGIFDERLRNLRK